MKYVRYTTENKFAIQTHITSLDIPESIDKPYKKSINQSNME